MVLGWWGVVGTRLGGVGGYPLVGFLWLVIIFLRDGCVVGFHLPLARACLLFRVCFLLVLAFMSLVSKKIKIKKLKIPYKVED